MQLRGRTVQSRVSVQRCARFVIPCARRSKCAPQVFGSSAPSRSARHPVQRCPRRKWIVLACQELLRSCRCPEPTRRDAHRSSLQGVAKSICRKSAIVCMSKPSVFSPSAFQLLVDDRLAAATKMNLLLCDEEPIRFFPGRGAPHPATRIPTRIVVMRKLPVGAKHTFKPS